MFWVMFLLKDEWVYYSRRPDLWSHNAATIINSYCSEMSESDSRQPCGSGHGTSSIFGTPWFVAPAVQSFHHILPCSHSVSVASCEQNTLFYSLTWSSQHLSRLFHFFYNFFSIIGAIRVFLNRNIGDDFDYATHFLLFPGKITFCQPEHFRAISWLGNLFEPMQSNKVATPCSKSILLKCNFKGNVCAGQNNWVTFCHF